MKHGFFGEITPFVKWLLPGIPVLFIVVGPLHFLFDLTGRNVLVGLLAPVNESPWEHLKLAFFPLLIWWGIGQLCFGKREKRALIRSALSCLVAETTCLAFILAFFYTYTGAFGIETLFLDILSLLLGLLVGVLLAVHVYTHFTPPVLSAVLSAVFLLIIACAFILFTFMPPHIPLFQDLPTGTYGF